MGEGHPARSEFDTLFVDHPGAPAGTTVLRTHTSPVQIRTMLAAAAADLHRRPRPGVPSRHARRHPHAGVPPDRGPRRRPGHQPGRPRRHDRGVHQGLLRRRLHVAPAPELLPVHRTVGGVRHPHARAASGSSSVAAAWCTPTSCAPAASTRRSGAGSPSGSASTAWPGSATASADIREMFTNDIRFLEQFCMKLLLSWLSEYVALPDDLDLDALADTLANLGLPVEEVVHTGGVAGVVTARVVRTEQHPDAAKVQRVCVDAGDGGKERHVWCGAFNMQPGDVVPLAMLGTDDAGRPHDRPPRHPRDRLRGHALLGARARARRRPQRHPRPARRQRRSACRTATSPGCAPTSCIDVDVTRNRPDCWSYIGVARDLAAKLGVAFTPARATGAEGRRRRRGHDRRDRRRRPLRPLHVDGHRRRRRRSVGAVDGRAPHRRRHAPDQQRRRRQQLRDARARPAEPRLRPGHARRVRVPHPPRRRGRDDHDARRVTRACSTATDLLICDATDAPIGIAGIMGGARHRDRRRHDHRRARDGLVRPTSASARPWPASACARRRRPASSAASTRTADRHGHRPLRRAARRDLPRPRRRTPAPSTPAAHRCPPSSARPTCASARSTASSAPRCAADDLPPLLDPIGYTVDRHRRRPHRRAADLAARQHRGDRRHRGGRPPLRLRPPRQDVPDGPIHGRSVTGPAAPALACARCCSGSGSPRRCPTRSSAPDTLERAGSTATPCGSPTRSSPTRACCARRCGPGCCRRSPTTSRTAAPAS